MNASGIVSWNINIYLDNIINDRRLFLVTQSTPPFSSLALLSNHHLSRRIRSYYIFYKLNEILIVNSFITNMPKANLNISAKEISFSIKFQGKCNRLVANYFLLM